MSLSGGTDVRRRALSTAAMVTAPLVVVVLALVHPGYPTARVELNDGAVWVTATDLLRLGRFNAQVEELNAGLVTTGGRFDVLQDGQDVLLVEPTTLSVVDPAGVVPAARLSLPAGAQVSMAAGTVAVVDASGDAWVRPVAGVADLQPGTDPPDLQVGTGGAVVVARTGTAFAVDGSSGDVTRLDLREGRPVAQPAGTFGVAVDQLTTVGDEPVGLAGSVLHTVHGEVGLAAADAVLQQPGPAADRVLAATRTALLEVSLHPEVVAVHRTGTSGAPAAPVRVGRCGHAAWATAAGSYLRLCDGAAPYTAGLEGLSTAVEPVFRVNRSVVVLNDVRDGRVWLPDRDTAVREPSWQDVVPEQDPGDQQQAADQVPRTVQESSAECGSDAVPPQAVDDDFGARAGRATILPVLDNDSSADCAILVISEVDPVPEAFGHLDLVYGGRALQLRVAPGAAGTVTFTYTITDGRGTTTPSTASVRVSVRDGDTPPAQVRVGLLVVEQGARVDRDVLGDFRDPDGDDLVLVAADAQVGTARFRRDGTVSYQADAATLGRTRVNLQVSDGTHTVPGMLDVEVRAAGSVPPQIDPVHEVTHVDQPVLVAPLAAVRSSSREPVRLAGVDVVPGATIVADLTAGTFTFTAARVGTYYVPFVVTAPPQQTTGLARIDVLEWPAAAQPPVAVRDHAYLTEGSEVSVDPLANDTDPSGGVLVLQGVDVPAGAGLRVAVLDHRYVQVSAIRTPAGPVTMGYTVSNGSASAQGEIVVHPVPPASTQQAPVVADVDVGVRTGGVVTIPVLAGAYDPDGDPVTLVRALGDPLGPGQGLLFVSGDVLRYQAPAEPVTVRTTFSVQDSAGNTTGAVLTVRVHASDAAAKSPPRPRDLTARVFEADTVRVTVPLVGIDDDGDGVSLLGVATPPAKGRIMAVGADWLEYQALPGETGTDTFTYAVEDWVGQRAVASVRVGIGPRPLQAGTVVTRDDHVTVRPGRQVEVRVLANDVDAGGSQLTLDEHLAMPDGTQARVEGRRVVVRAPDEPAALQIVYTARDDRGGRDTGVLTVTVTPDAPVLPPVARDVVVPATETLGRASVEVDVLAVAQNPSGPLSDLVVSIPAASADVASVSPSGSVVVALVDHTQTIPYRLTNRTGDGDSASAWAFVTVPALGFFPPTLRPRAGELRVASGAQLVIPIDEQVQVAPGRSARVADPASVSATRADGSGLVRDAATLTYRSAPGYAGPASITLTVTDATGPVDPDARTAVLTLPIMVVAVDDHPPAFVASVMDVSPGETPVTVDLGMFTTGPDGRPATGSDAYSYRLTSAVPAGFSATVADGVLTVGAPRTTPKGTTGVLDLALGYGRAGSMDVQVPVRVVASTRPAARVPDRTVSDAVEGRDSVVDVLAGAYNPFPGEPLTVVGASVETAGSGTAGATRTQVSVRPAEGFIGTMVVRFRVQDATGDPDREVEGHVTVLVRGKPDVPAAPRVTEVRDGAVVLSWDAPDGRGAPITGYRVVASPGGASRDCPTTTCAIDGLTNDVDYRFTVAARNVVDWSPASEPSAPARPDAVPGPPGTPVLQFGDGQLTATWDAAVSTGSAVTGYTVEISPVPSSGPGTLQAAGTSATLRGLTNGTAYRVRVRAVNRARDPGPWSALSAAEIPAGVPGTPTPTAERKNTRFPGNGTIEVTWPAVDPDGDPVHYEVQVHKADGQLLATVVSGTSYQITDAVRGSTYQVDVRAVNKAGASEWGSTTGEVWSSPSLPQQLGATASVAGDSRPWADGTVSLTWAAPADAGGAGYTIREYEVEGRGATTALQMTVGGLEGGASPTFRVRAVSSRGDASNWASVTSGIVVTRPQAPVLTVTTGAEDQVDVATADGRTGGSPVTARWYRIDAGAWQPGTPPATVPGQGGAPVTVEYQVCTEAGCSDVTLARATAGTAPPPGPAP